jgi:sugar lactone lactonase YvrE
VLSGLEIPNSIGWSPDLKTLYFTHSTASQVFAFDYNPEDGSVSNKRVFYHHQGTGGPDGFRVDSEGNVWHAIYGEARVVKISPEGKLIGEVKIPTNNATCVQFVGTELFITSASDDNAEGGEISKKYGGGLFRVDVGVTGVEPFAYKL